MRKMSSGESRNREVLRRMHPARADSLGGPRFELDEEPHGPRGPRDAEVPLEPVADGEVRGQLEVLAAQPAPPGEEDSGQAAFDNADQVHHGLAQLSLPFREVLTLFFLEDFSIDAIAEILGVPPGTVKSRLYHAKQALRAVIEKEE